MKVRSKGVQSKTCWRSRTESSSVSDIGVLVPMSDEGLSETKRVAASKGGRDALVDGVISAYQLLIWAAVRGIHAALVQPARRIGERDRPRTRGPRRTVHWPCFDVSNGHSRICPL